MSFGHMRKNLEQKKKKIKGQRRGGAWSWEEEKCEEQESDWKGEDVGGFDPRVSYADLNTTFLKRRKAQRMELEATANQQSHSKEGGRESRKQDATMLLQPSLSSGNPYFCLLRTRRCWFPLPPKPWLLSGSLSLSLLCLRLPESWDPNLHYRVTQPLLWL